jgi:phosphoribosylanthranilate isomerase
MRLKICGITRVEDLQACTDLGVDAVGINLWSGSKRGLSLPAAARLLESAGPGGPARIGVFVDPLVEALREAVRTLNLEAVQLHGDAPLGRYAGLGIPYVWVLRGARPLDQLKVPQPLPAWVLLDAQTPEYGGAGHRTDWNWARAAVRHFAPLPVWLAGGITPDNAAQAIGTVGPAGLDVASGAELSTDSTAVRAVPGAKDRARIAALVATCRG